MDIHQNQLRIPFLPAFDGCFAVIGSSYRKSNGGQQFHQPIKIRKLVVGDQVNSAVTIVFYLWRQAFVLSHAGYASAIAIALLGITMLFSVVLVRVLERGEELA